MEVICPNCEITGIIWVSVCVDHYMKDGRLHKVYAYESIPCPNCDGNGTYDIP